MMIVWLLRREYARWLWRHRRVTFGEFCDRLAGAPPSIALDTRPFWESKP